MLELSLIIAAVGAIIFVLIAQTRSTRLRNLAIGLLISYLTTVLLLGGIEAYMRCCYFASDNIPTLSQQNWWSHYVQPNRYGYRDWDWSADALANKTVIAAIGDSFTNGNGIDDPADRYTDVLASLLAANQGDPYAVVNLGVSGTATVEQLDALKQFTLATPDVIIWQYFLNDINYTGLKLGISPQAEELPKLVRESHLANYLYWRFFPPTSITATDGTTWSSWWEWTYAAYDNSGIYGEHEQELKAIVDYADSIDAELIVLIFPDLAQIMRSIPLVDRVAQSLVGMGVPSDHIVKLFDDAAAWNPNDLVVSIRDTHPSVSFHHHVGELLYERFFKP